MKSMTGYGKGKIKNNDFDIDIEIKSVNGKFLDLRMYLPRDVNFFEVIIRKKLSATLTRGSIEIRVSFSDHREPRIQLNSTKLKKYFQIVQEARKELNITKDTDLEFLLGEPGVIETVSSLDDDPALKKGLEDCLDEALSELVASMETEASAMKSTIFSIGEHISGKLMLIESEIQPYKEELFTNMKKRTSDLLQSFNNENLEQRLFQELAIYIDKYDIYEELTRLRSHIITLQKTLDRADDCGKTLNFILQEMQREANTLGSKFSTAKVFPHILYIKEEIEKCREIVQNVA